MEWSRVSDVLEEPTDFVPDLGFFCWNFCKDVEVWGRDTPREFDV